MSLPLLLFTTVLVAPSAEAADRRTPIVQAVEKATPAVVTIAVETQQQPGLFWFYDAGPAVSEGSGVIIDPSGIVLTNAHVIEGALSVTVHTEGHGTHTARVMALEHDLDLAVLKLDGVADLPTIPVANSDRLMLGEPAIAIGNPYALGMTVSTGIVSSTAREVEVEPGLFQTYVQTDAAINPGNSGGALVNINGELIGINTMIRMEAEGIGWAIPANRAMKVAGDLLSYGEVQTPWLGCDFRDVSSYRAWGMPLSEGGGILVERVHPDSPCEKSGLRRGDVVYAVSDRPAVSRADLMAHLAEKEPGVKLTVAWYRGNNAESATLTTATLPKEIVDVSMTALLGVTVEPLSNVLVVTNMTDHGAWARARLRPGDAILAVDGRRVSTAEDLKQALLHAKSKHRSSALFTVQRGPYSGSMNLPI